MAEKYGDHEVIFDLSPSSPTKSRMGCLTRLHLPCGSIVPANARKAHSIRYIFQETRELPHQCNAPQFLDRIGELAATVFPAE